MEQGKSDILTGRCYCGAITFEAHVKPQTVLYCHCDSCRRSTGGVLAAFAGFGEGDVVFSPNEGKHVRVNPGVERSFCADCGSSMVGRYDYLPDQVFVSLGVIDQAEELKPEMHAHDGERLTWLHIEDDLAREHVTASGPLNVRAK